MKAFAASLAFLCAPLVFAEAEAEFPFAGKWEADKQDALTVIVNSKGEYIDRGYTAEIAINSNGKKSIYISILHPDTNFCDPKDFINTSVVKINGQAIKVAQWCKPFDTSNNFVQFAALTPKGSEYIINQFKNSPEKVMVSYLARNYSFPISAVGFTQAWNAAGEDAF